MYIKYIPNNKPTNGEVFNLRYVPFKYLTDMLNIFMLILMHILSSQGRHIMAHLLNKFSLFL